MKDAQSVELILRENILNPQQGEFKFKNIHFSSKFDSGNLCSAREIDPWSYELQISRDSNSSYKVFYHFSVTNFTPNETYTFILRNLMPQGKLYNAGLRPVYKPFPSEQQWKTIPGEIIWRTETDGFLVRFDHIFSEKDKSVSFAFTYPFSYEEITQMVDQVQEKCEENKDIYFKRETLVHSLEKRKMELITITDTSEMTTDEEPLIKGCFPLHK